MPRPWDESLVQDACQLLAEDLPLKPGAPGGQVEYRRSLATSFFFKFYLNVSQRLSNNEVGHIFVDLFLGYVLTSYGFLEIEVLVLLRFNAFLTQRTPLFLYFTYRTLEKSVFDLVSFGFRFEIDHIV